MSVAFRLRQIRDTFASFALGAIGAPKRFLWAAIPLIAGSILWVEVDNQIASERSTFERTLSLSAQSIASGYAQFFARSIDQMDQVTLQLKYEWERSKGRFRLGSLAERGIFSSAQYAEVVFVDNKGDVVTSTSAAPAARSYAARDGFRRHRTNISSALRISPLERDAATGRSVIRFSRRLDSGDDDFDGMVVVSVYSDYFSAFYDTAALGQRGLLVAVGADGQMRASRIGSGETPIGNAALARVPRFGERNDGDALSPNGDGWLEPHWFVDGARRFVSWRTLQAYPITVMAGLSEAEFIGPLRAKWETYRRMRLAAEAALFALAIVLAYAGYVADRRKTQRNSVQAAYRLATEAGEEGFYMLVPVRQSNRIVDFRVLDCNERGAWLFGKRKRELLGQTISENYRADDFEHLLKLYCHAMEVGSYREEDEFQPIGNPTLRWVRRKVVRSGSELAVTLRDISDAKAQQEELIRLATTDELTGLPNRSWFLKSLESTIVNASANGKTVALLFIDLDKFKNVNDTLGHSSGDIVLKEAALRLRHALRPSEHVARLGGDEFTVMLHHVAGDAEILRIANRILQAMAYPFQVGDAVMEVGASIGISVYPRDGATAETLLKHADIAMYSTKAKRRGTYAFYQQEFYDTLKKRINTERELAEAIERDEFELHYQPRVDAVSGELLSLEALVRWRHPHRGMVPPLEFIPIAESTGLIARLGALVIDKACRQLAQWRDEGMAIVPVSVNVSAVQFQHGDVHELLRHFLAKSNIPPSLIEVEITESAMLGEHTSIIERLTAIQRLGIKIAVDDFGTGYSSLSQLQRLDMDVLKVDRVFTADLAHSIESHVLFKAIVSMAHALDMKVVAEGVETEIQATILRDLGCDELQGYFISRPVASDAAKAMLSPVAGKIGARA